MKYGRYELEADKNFLIFTFTSVGPKGKIFKVVEYVESKQKNYYNLGFGDRDEESGYIDDIIVTNNGDSEKVLATVVCTLYEFTSRHPSAWVYAKGSTVARTRLYRMGITNNLNVIERDFYLFGLLNLKWHKFEKNVEYEAFLVQKK